MEPSVASSMMIMMIMMLKTLRGPKDDHDDDVKNFARPKRFLCQSTNILGILKTVNVPNRDSGTLSLYTNVA